MHRALQLEEIRTALARFLDVGTTAACARCCREWYQSFARHVWHSVVLRHPVAWLPPLKSIEANKHRIYRLTVNRFDRIGSFFFTGCSNLTFFNLDDPTLRLRDMDKYWAPFVVHHQETLQHLVIRSAITQKFCVAMASCTKLKTLQLAGRLTHEENGALLWNACQTLHTLRVENCPLPTWDQNTVVSTSRLQRLIVDKAQWRCNALELLKQCPQLRYLSWRDSVSIMLPLQSMGQALLKDHQWPLLEELNLELITSKDQDLAMVIKGIHRLVSLRLVRSRFGARCVTAIRMHHSTLTTLNLAVCSQVTSPMIQTLLTTMTALESLITGRIHYLDIVNGAPWVSVRLQRLVIAIDMKKPPKVELEEQKKKRKPSHRDITAKSPFETHQCAVFQRLSTLERLRFLTLSSPTLKQDEGQTLDLRLYAGLGSLSTLKRLETFSFKSLHQCMTIRDIKWIYKHWPCLRTISGQFAIVLSNRYEITSFLKRRGITVRSCPPH